MRRYKQSSTEIRAGDRVLLFSDGAVEVANSDGRPRSASAGSSTSSAGRLSRRRILKMDALEEELLKYSNVIRLEDDLTMIEVRFNRL